MVVSKTATQRLKHDYLRIKQDPVPYVTAEPVPSNLLEWHYILYGPENTPYAGGIYHGKLVFPHEFPFKPPSIYMITPNGRFMCHRRLCLSMSDFHPDTWNPSWSVSTILTGLLSFMLEKSSTTGSIETLESTKKQLALNSLSFNIKDKTFCELFPEEAKKIEIELERREKEMSESKNPINKMSSLKRTNSTGDWNSSISYYLSHLAFFGGVAFFAYLVNQVFKATQ